MSMGACLCGKASIFDFNHKRTSVRRFCHSERGGITPPMRIKQRVLAVFFSCCIILLSACSGKAPQQPSSSPVATAPPLPTATPSPTVREMDWGDFFQSFHGTAVLYEPARDRYSIYNPTLAQVRRSPCSTFKIISSLIALESGVIVPGDSTLRWSGERFWNPDWNRDMDFPAAFRTSCVWYFRQIIDTIGQPRMQQALATLDYGNCDISDWQGRLNTNNDNPVLTGFWIESSLKISPKEQVDVMARIFGDDSPYAPQTLEQLQQVMLVSEPTEALAIYGKTGMGKAEGVVVDAWFTGFAQMQTGPVYFCVYLGQTPGADVSSAKAKDIACRILADYARTSASAQP